MKKWDVVDWVLFMLGAAVGIVLIVVFCVPVLMGVQTTPDNKELRSEMFSMLDKTLLALMGLLAFKFKGNNEK